jgi:hypothetical protein
MDARVRVKTVETAELDETRQPASAAPRLPLSNREAVVSQAWDETLATRGMKMRD